MAIQKKQRAEGLGVDDEVVLKYRRFETKTMKYFVDALYLCNVEPIPLPELLKLLQLTSKMENFECILTWKKEIDALYRKELDGIGDIKFEAKPHVHKTGLLAPRPWMLTEEMTEN